MSLHRASIIRGSYEYSHIVVLLCPHILYAGWDKRETLQGDARTREWGWVGGKPWSLRHALDFAFLSAFFSGQGCLSEGGDSAVNAPILREVRAQSLSDFQIREGNQIITPPYDELRYTETPEEGGYRIPNDDFFLVSSSFLFFPFLLWSDVLRSIPRTSPALRFKISSCRRVMAPSCCFLRT